MHRVKFFGSATMTETLKIWYLLQVSREFEGRKRKVIILINNRVLLKMLIIQFTIYTQYDIK